MAKQNIKSKKGFTIIEVVLVLAIAGLIFLMVFIALPALQRSQRDTQRRNDMARVGTAINQFQTNNNGKLPTANDTSSFKTRYLDAAENFVDPDGEAYTIYILDGTSGHTWDASSAISNGTLPFNHIVYIVHKAVCDGEKVTSENAKARDYAIVYRLEGSGTYCADSK